MDFRSSLVFEIFPARIFTIYSLLFEKVFYLKLSSTGGVSPPSVIYKFWNTQICMTIQNHYWVWCDPRKINFCLIHFQDIFNHRLCSKSLTFYKKQFSLLWYQTTAKLKNCPILTHIRPNDSKKNFFGYADLKLSKFYAFPPIYGFKVDISRIVK